MDGVSNKMDWPWNSVSNTSKQVPRDSVSKTKKGSQDIVSNTLKGLKESVSNMQKLPTDSM